MKVIINRSIYEMNQKQADRVMKVASEHIPYGIYAVEKDGIVELRKDKCKSKSKLNVLIRQFELKGFNVYYNEGRNSYSITKQKKN